MTTSAASTHPRRRKTARLLLASFSFRHSFVIGLGISSFVIASKEVVFQSGAVQVTWSIIYAELNAKGEDRGAAVTGWKPAPQK